MSFLRPRFALLVIPLAAALYFLYGQVFIAHAGFHVLEALLNLGHKTGSPGADIHDAPATFTRRIVAVGDLHGDIGNAQKVLNMAGVVDQHGNWSGDIDFFVQTGDIIDRGDDTIKLYFWMDRLRDQARAAGGEVLSMLGNHEYMNLMSDWRYVYPSEIATFGSWQARQKMLATGRIGKSWAANYTTASRLPLHPSLGPPNTDYPPPPSSPLLSEHPLSHAALSFVHGGLAPAYPDLTPFPSRINTIASSLLHKLQRQSSIPPPHPPHPYPGLPAGATTEEHRLYGSDGPLWYRGWAMDPEETVCAAVDDVLEKTGTRRMLMGHTPNFEKIVSRCNGKIIIIDTGISHAYGGALSALSITYTLTPIPDSGGEGDTRDGLGSQSVLEIRTTAQAKVKRWKEREIVVALYADRQEVLAVDERMVDDWTMYDTW
ncbi:Metallo-dependent phosphatase [Punctularia strigosozonata HHB-11173 SS5]|uniref:Metallo-dependent phosphatase n=1 Tax=Punctularia strigosozonata (strain HHB-11173) TaxID=741275 RepID=R7S348_PUNST|nr:Metallo-dependent phosphatase [Punctularia strigosozonata HHB-11173 SS5]EIN04810.1 Metallo-dependent phosphatase [Punctularia strigosozonata HHB-11173 SS5]